MIKKVTIFLTTILLSCVFLYGNPQKVQALGNCLGEVDTNICTINNIDSIFLAQKDIALIDIETRESEKIADSPLDIVFVQDLTGTFKDDLPNIRRLMPDVVTYVKNQQPDTWFGMVSFTDKPNNIFQKSRGYVYKTELALTADEEELQETVNFLETVPLGGDNEEDPLDGILQMALREDFELGFRDYANHVAIVLTDYTYHEQGDFADFCKVPPNDGDTVTENNGLGEDYPSVAQVKEALDQKNIIPIFMVADDCLSVYQELVDQLGRGTVVSLSLNSSNLVSAVEEGLENIFSN